MPPYIPEGERPFVDPTSTRLAATPGELNFQITRLCNWYIGSHGISYGVLNEIVGVLECAKLELYRRKVVQYENEKILLNGDVV